MLNFFIWFCYILAFFWIINNYKDWISFFKDDVYFLITFIVIISSPLIFFISNKAKGFIKGYLWILIVPLIFFIFDPELDKEKQTVLLLIAIYLLFLYTLVTEYIKRYNIYTKFIEWKKYFSDKKYNNISNKFKSKFSVQGFIDDNNIGYLDLVLNSKTVNFYIKHNLPSWYIWYEDFLNIPIPRINPLFNNCSSEEEFERLLIKSYWNFTDDEIKIILKNG